VCMAEMGVSGQFSGKFAIVMQRIIVLIVPAVNSYFLKRFQATRHLVNNVLIVGSGWGQVFLLTQIDSLH
jgi:hypothetical protein